jgi:hypothetical protein
MPQCVVRPRTQRGVRSAGGGITESGHAFCGIDQCTRLPFARQNFPTRLADRIKPKEEIWTDWYCATLGQFADTRTYDHDAPVTISATVADRTDDFKCAR